MSTHSISSFFFLVLIEKFYGYSPMRATFAQAVVDDQTPYRAPYYQANFVLVK